MHSALTEEDRRRRTRQKKVDDTKTEWVMQSEGRRDILIVYVPYINDIVIEDNMKLRKQTGQKSTEEEDGDMIAYIKFIL